MQGLGFCNKLFALERDWAEATPEERREQRQAHSRPVVEAYRKWLKAKENGLIPFNYLQYLFEQLPQLTDPLDAEALEPFMPWSDSLPANCRLKKS